MCSLIRTFPLISSLSDEFDFLLYIPLFTSMWRLTRLFLIVGTLLSHFILVPVVLRQIQHFSTKQIVLFLLVKIKEARNKIRFFFLLFVFFYIDLTSLERSVVRWLLCQVRGRLLCFNPVQFLCLWHFWKTSVERERGRLLNELRQHTALRFFVHICSTSTWRPLLLQFSLLPVQNRAPCWFRSCFADCDGGCCCSSSHVQIF